MHFPVPVPHARFGESTDTSKRKSLNITTSPSPKDPTTAFPTSKVGVTHPSDTHTVSPSFVYRASELASGATGIPVQFPRRSLNLTTLPKHSSVIDILRNTSSQKTSTVEIPTPLHTSSYVSSGERSLNASISNSTVSSIKEHVDAIPVTIERRSMVEEDLKVQERRKASWVHDVSGVKRVEPRSGSERFLDSLSRIPEGNPTTNAIKFESTASGVEPLRSEKRFSTSGSDGDRKFQPEEWLATKSIDDRRSSTDFGKRSSSLFVPTSVLTENHSSTFMSRGVNTMVADQNSESADEDPGMKIGDEENFFELRSSEFEGFPPPAQQERALETTPNNGEQSSQLFILESQLE